MDVVTIMFSTNPTFSWTKCETGFINIHNYSIIYGDFSSKLYFPLSNGNSIPCLNYEYHNSLKYEDQVGFTCLEYSENYVFYFSNSQPKYIN